MIDIDAADLSETFEISNGTIGQIGYGYIGNAVVELFKPFCKTLIYDKAKPELGTLENVVGKSEVIFIAVPTPMEKTGECHTGIVEAVLQDIQNTAVRIGRELDSFIVVIKSTVPPGFTKKMDDKYALRILFSPEFLTEARSVEDFKKTNRVLLGGDLEDAQIVYRYFAGVWQDRIPENYVDHPDGPVYIVQSSSTVAEMVKLSTNVHLMSKVLVSNELYLVCQKLGVDYSEVKRLTQLDRRIGLSHMDVPGPDGKLGAGGSCFPKDVNNLRWVCESLGIDEKMFTVIHERNVEIRGADWEELKGRAVVS